MAVLDAPPWQLDRERLRPKLWVARRARHPPHVGHAGDLVRRDQRVEVVERVRRVPHGERAHAREARASGAQGCYEGGPVGTVTCVAYPRRRAWSRSTTSRPKGVSETGMSLKFASPSGIPMMVRHISTPVMRWPSASHQPASTNQMMLPMTDPAPASGRRVMVRPNGHRQNSAMRADAMPNGMVMIKTNITSATMA